MLLTVVVAFVVLVLGVLFVFLGYRYFSYLLPAWGFIIGFMAGAGVVALLGDGYLSTPLSWGVGLLLGILFAILSYFYQAVGILILGGALGYGLALYFTLVLDVHSTFVTVAIGIIGALIGAGLTVILNLEKPLIIALVSLAGSVLIVTGLLLFFGQVLIDDIGSGQALDNMLANSFFWLFLWLMFAGLGYIIQSRLDEGSHPG